MKRRRLNLNKPVKMLTLVANPDSSVRPAGTELVPLGARVHLSSSRTGRIARACSQQAAVFVRWIWGASRRVVDLGRSTVEGLGYGASSTFQGARATARVLHDGTTKAIGLARPGHQTSEQQLLIAMPSSLEAVPHESELRDEVRMLRAQVQTQNQILAELTRVLLEEKNRVRESDQLTGHHDRQSESRLLRVLEANVSQEENWGTSKPTNARVNAD